MSDLQTWAAATCSPRRRPRPGTHHPCVRTGRCGRQPPGGGAAGALSHAVIHSLDVTIAHDRPAAALRDAVVAVLDQLAGANGALFGVDLTGVRLEAIDTD
jgi:hypothetical protein